MSSAHLDDLAREFARPQINRRRMLGRFAAVLAGAAGAGLLEADPASANKPGGGITCPPGLVACGSACRNVAIDPDHCGGCSTSCGPNQLCRGGTCVDIPCTCPLPCPSGQQLCNGVCTDTTSDGGNCGGCGVTCPSGQTCVGGTCVTPGVCTPGQTASCGSSVGVCTQGTQTCQSDGTWGPCVGATGPDSGYYCDGLDHNCDGVVDSCPAGMTCGNNGMCVAACPSGQTLCNGTCVDTSTDPSNCGTCNSTCSASSVCVTATCVNGTCQHVNAPAGVACAPSTCSGGTMTSYVCNGAGVCSGVSSSCAPYICNATSTGCTSSCTNDAGCASGFICSNGVCVAA